METNKIMQHGYGHGSGDIVNALPRKKIVEIIENSDFTECVKMAFDAQNPEYQNGFCVIEIQTGEICSFSMSYNSDNQACDRNYVILYSVGQNEECPWDTNEDEIIEEIINNKEYFPKTFNKYKNKNTYQEDSFFYDVKKENEEKFEEIINEIKEENKYCFEPYENDFDWEYINERLDSFYDYE